MLSCSSANSNNDINYFLFSFTSLIFISITPSNLKFYSWHLIIKEKLNSIALPDIYMREGKECYYDTYRKKLIEITPEETVRQRIASYFEKVSLNAQIRNITLLHSSSTSNNNYPQYKAPPPDYAPIHGLSSLLS